jgi:hypothetical protein
VNGFGRLDEQILGVADFLPDGFRGRAAILFYGRQRDADRRERLANFVVQFAADAFSFLLLAMQDLIGQAAKIFLHAARAEKHLAQMVFAFPQRPL